MKNAMQLKTIIKKLAKEKNISAQLVMQNFMLERLLERISMSKYQSNFILKGGFLIAAMVGLDTRATMDMDVTIKGLPVNEETVRDMFEDICKIELNDDVIFSFSSIGEIRQGDEYTGYRVHLTANYPPMAVPLKLDITTGDKITPREVKYSFKLLLEDRNISVLAYNLETVLAEKQCKKLARRAYYSIRSNRLDKAQIEKSVLCPAFFLWGSEDSLMEEKGYMDLLTSKIKPMYFKYLAAAFGSALISSIYGAVDMAMVGQYQGPEGTAALAVVAPVWNIIYSLGLLMGIGGSVLFTVLRGKSEHNQKKSNLIFVVKRIL